MVLDILLLLGIDRNGPHHIYFTTIGSLIVVVIPIATTTTIFVILSLHHGSLTLLANQFINGAL